MKRIFSIALLLCTMFFFFSSCKKNSDNARHIPKEATAVLSIDMASISKKLAMDMLFNSDMFKNMSKKAGKDSSNFKGLQDAGIDFLNTFYAYATPDKRYSGEQHVVALIPLSDDGKWDAYVKKTFANAQIKDVDKRKEGLLGDGMYAAWDNKLLVITNTIYAEQPMMQDTVTEYVAPKEDLVQTAGDMDNIFRMTKENSIVGNKRFSELEKAGHDISFWVNYENIMNNYGTGMMGGFTMSPAMLKDAVFIAGIDFDNGAVNSDMKYYMSDEMKNVMKDVMNGKTNKELVERLPANNLDVLAALSFSPKALKGALDKFGYLGIMNAGLAEMNMTGDDVFEAFTGDMGFAMNNLRVSQKMVTYTRYDENGTEVPDSIASSTSDMDWIYVLKIDKQEKFDKILQFAISTQIFTSTGPGTYTVKNAGSDGMQITVKDKYLVIANKPETANGFIAGTNKGQKLHDVAAKEVYNHPMTMFFDIKQMLKAVGSENLQNEPGDAARFAELQKVFDNALVTGGEFKDDAFQYKASLNFINKEDNSLMQLINMASKISEIKEKQEPVVTAR